MQFTYNPFTGVLDANDTTSASTVPIGATITGGTQGSILYVGAGSALSQSNSDLFFDSTNVRLGLGTNSSSAKFAISGDNSSVAWGASGPGLRIASANYTDTSTADGATVSAAHIHTFAAPTIQAANATTTITYTNAATLQITGAPIPGTNVVISNAYALNVNSGDINFSGTNNRVLGSTTSLWGIGTGISTLVARLTISSNNTASAWGLNGIGVRINAAIYTDSTSSGPVTSNAIHTIARPTLVASSSTTYASTATLYIANAPLSSTNVVQTNSNALWVDDGQVRLDQNLILGDGNATVGSYPTFGFSTVNGLSVTGTTSIPQLSITRTGDIVSGGVFGRIVAGFFKSPDQVPGFRIDFSARSGTEQGANADFYAYNAAGAAFPTNSSLDVARMGSFTLGSNYYGGLVIGTVADPTHQLDIEGSMGFKVTSVDATTTYDDGTVYISFTLTADRTFTIPAASSRIGRMIVLKRLQSDTSGFSLTITRSGSDTFDGATSFTMIQGESRILVANSANLWDIN